MKKIKKIMAGLMAAAMIASVGAVNVSATTTDVEILPNTLEQIVAEDTSFADNSLIYSDKYKFAMEYGSEDDLCDTLVVYGIPDEDCYGYKWNKHIVINEDLYPCMRDVYHFPTGAERTICSGWTYHVGCADMPKYVFEKPLRIMFFVEGEEPYTFDSMAAASEAYGFDIEPYVYSDNVTSDEYIVPENTVPTKYGDVNDDSCINVADIVALNMFILDYESYPLSDTQMANSDCTKDNVVNSNDSAALMNVVAMIEN